MNKRSKAKKPVRVRAVKASTIAEVHGALKRAFDRAKPGEPVLNAGGMVFSKKADPPSATPQKTKPPFWPKFYKFRNAAGEIVCCAMPVTDQTQGPGLLAGFAFCSPDDFNVSHKLRVRRGEDIAKGRLDHQSLFVSCAGLKDDYHLAVRRYIATTWVENVHMRMNFKAYHGDQARERLSKNWEQFVRLFNQEQGFGKMPETGAPPVNKA